LRLFKRLSGQERRGFIGGPANIFLEATLDFDINIACGRTERRRSFALTSSIVIYHVLAHRHAIVTLL
jgi:hypothetical protein